MSWLTEFLVFDERTDCVALREARRYRDGTSNSTIPYCVYSRKGDHNKRHDAEECVFKHDWKDGSLWINLLEAKKIDEGDLCEKVSFEEVD